MHTKSADVSVRREKEMSLLQTVRYRHLHQGQMQGDLIGNLQAPRGTIPIACLHQDLSINNSASGGASSQERYAESSVVKAWYLVF